MCCFSTLPPVNAFPHCEHTYGRSPVCTRMWTVTLWAMVKPLPHTVHLNGLSPVWVSLWVRIAPPAVEKHCEHKCSFKLLDFGKLFPHCPQSWLRPCFGQ
uniref:Uncharacterized protein n=1 Tax=Salarias fasciatus TaxID=181472 RepID=A0A672I6Q0_SALFA